MLSFEDNLLLSTPDARDVWSLLLMSCSANPLQCRYRSAGELPLDCSSASAEICLMISIIANVTLNFGTAAPIYVYILLDQQRFLENQPISGSVKPILRALAVLIAQE